MLRKSYMQYVAIHNIKFLFALFIKTLLLLFLPHVKEMREIRRSADHPAKTERFNVARDNLLMSQ